MTELLRTPSCGLCRRGWVDYWPWLRSPYTIDALMTSVAIAVPCRCTMGKNIGPDKRGDVPRQMPDDIWRIIQEQHAAWNGSVKPIRVNDAKTKKELDDISGESY